MTEGRTDVTQGFQQQDQVANFVLPKCAPLPQHGQKADPAAVKAKARRVKELRPGH